MGALLENHHLAHLRKQAKSHAEGAVDKWFLPLNSGRDLQGGTSRRSWQEREAGKNRQLSLLRDGTHSWRANWSTRIS
jgi:hypothetical protein